MTRVLAGDGSERTWISLGHGDGLELEYPVRLVAPPSWLGHTPFALWLVGAMKPRMLVELGVLTGNSYCAFLQAVQTQKLDTRCFGIDHWHGDAHSGFYGDEVYEEVRGHHDLLYGTFSTLLRCPFDDALPYFSDGSIDLLHIDGFHTYEAVAHDFESWLPRMSGRGVVLLHATNVRERGCGVWRLWEELAPRYPTFELSHADGLGVVYVGSEPVPGPLAALFTAKTDVEIARVRGYFARLGRSVEERFSLSESGKNLAVLQTRLAALEADLRTARIEAMRAGERASGLAVDYEAKLRAATRQAESQASILRHRRAMTTRLQSELLAAHRTLNEVFRSKSWRLTASIRSAGTTLRRMLGRST